MSTLRIRVRFSRLEPIAAPEPHGIKIERPVKPAHPDPVGISLDVQRAELEPGPAADTPKDRPDLGQGVVDRELFGLRVKAAAMRAADHFAAVDALIAVGFRLAHTIARRRRCPS